MTIFNDYTDDGHLISSRSEMLSPTNLAHYLKEYGCDRILGYRDAIADILEFIQTNVLNEGPGELAYDASPTRTRSALVKFYERERQFLQKDLSDCKSNHITPQ